MYIELSDGHVFVPNSVKSITPVIKEDVGDYFYTFKAIGVGFIVNFYSADTYMDKTAKDNFIALHKEAKEKLLGV